MNQIPDHKQPFRLAVIGEGPDDADQGTPFNGSSGKLVGSILSRFNIPINRVFLGYVSTKKTWGYFQSSSDDAVRVGTRQLIEDLTKFGPNCCLLLGELANEVFGAEHKASVQRGTVFISPHFRFKCVSSLDPWQIMRDYRMIVPFNCDFKRAIDQAQRPDMPNHYWNMSTMPTFGQLVERFEQVLRDKPNIAFDLEGHPNQLGVTCYSIAPSNDSAFIVPLRNMDCSPCWSEEEETIVWDYTRRILGDPSIKKIAQNAMYELFVFAWRHKLLVRGISDDTMFQAWELFSELPKDLGFLSSVHTDLPYYKSERTVPDLSVHHEYCCKDSLATRIVRDKQEQQMTNPVSRKHYQFNVRLLKPYLYMQLRGCKLDMDKLTEMKANTWGYIQKQQAIVNEMTGTVLNTKSPKQLQEYLYGTLHLPEQFKPIAGKKTLTADFGALCALYTSSQLPVLLEIAKLSRARTRLSDLNKLQPFADGRIRCNYNPVGTETGRLSSSETWVEAIIDKPKIEFKKRSKDGKPYTEMLLSTKRVVECLGTNLQNVFKDLRVAFIPDNSDYSFYQYDLSGADAWTVAADLAALGNDKMLEHLRAGIKPSIVIVLLTEFGNVVYQWDQTTLKAHHDQMLDKCKKIPKLVRTYVCAKGCQHGTNYGMQAKLMAALQLERAVQGFIDNHIKGSSEEPEFKVFHHNTIDRLQRLYYDFYGLELRNEWIRRQLSNHGYMDAASGQRRYFLDIRNRRQIDDAIVRTAASHEPQANTTWATNAALLKMFEDLENRTPRGNLRCEPLLMIHDALAGQAHKSQQEWAEGKMAEWFNNPLIIHGIDINIPVEGGWGDNWMEV